MSGLLLACIVAPVKLDETEKIDVKEMIKEKSVFEAIGNGAIDGGKIALIVSAMFNAYTSLIAMFNAGLMTTIGIELQTILGYAVVSTFLISFASFSSIGINVGTVQSLKYIYLVWGT